MPRDRSVEVVEPFLELEVFTLQAKARVEPPRDRISVLVERVCNVADSEAVAVDPSIRNQQVCKYVRGTHLQLLRGGLDNTVRLRQGESS